MTHANIATGQDGSPMGKTYTVLGINRDSAVGRAFETAYGEGYYAATVLDAAENEAGWWDVTITFLDTSPALGRITFEQALANLAREYAVPVVAVVNHASRGRLRANDVDRMPLEHVAVRTDRPELRSIEVRYDA